ncbi:MAG: hypothetical protein IT324_03915 [Anaerolineae bacterium]|nr:hypothetical protein [Anaerolineae bacterium]
MQTNYSTFLNYRVAQRRLAAKFARPRWLILHTLTFVVTLLAVWAYGTGYRLWFYRDNFILPTLVGLVWSVLLAAHALFHYRRSAARAGQREHAVEEAMQAFIDQNGDSLDQPALFAMHQQLERDLESQGRWSTALAVFSLVNPVSWLVTALNMGTSWAFQMTGPLAVLSVGGISVYLLWQQQRQQGRDNWFVRLPLWHVALYGVGVLGLWLAGAYRAINYWDADTLIKGWGLVLLVHIVWSVAVQPLLRNVLPGLQREQAAKRKPAARLVLGDDGEVLDVTDQDEQSYHIDSSEAQTISNQQGA